MSRVSEAMRRAALSRVTVHATRTSTSSLPAAELDDYQRETPTVDHLSRPLAPRTTLRPVESERPAVVARPSPEPFTDFKPAHSAVGPFHRIAGALLDIQSRSTWAGDTARDRQLRTLLVTSATAGEGRTLTVVNLARSLSEDYGRRVLIIDADLRRPAVHDRLGISNASGFTDVLRSAGRDVPIHQVAPLLSVLPAGPGVPGEFPVFAESTCEALRESGSRFDWVLLDGPPVISAPDACRVLARFARAVLLVIAGGHTPSQLVRRAITEVGRASIVGTVLNSGQR